MAQEAKNTTVSDFWLGAYVRPIHPEFFRICARRAFRRPAYDAEFWLTDPGHVFTIVSNGSCITEILVRQGTELPKRGLLKRWELRREHDESFQLRGSFFYQVSYQVEQMSHKDYISQEQELRASALKEGVFRIFDDADASAAGPLYGLGKVPFAYALPEPRADAFLLQTFHGFPAERIILKTQTVIDVAR